MLIGYYSDKHNGICRTLKMTVVSSSPATVKHLARDFSIVYTSYTIYSFVILLHLSNYAAPSEWTGSSAAAAAGDLPLSLVKRSFKTLLYTTCIGGVYYIRDNRKRHLLKCTVVMRVRNCYRCFDNIPGISIFPLDESARPRRPKNVTAGFQ